MKTKTYAIRNTDNLIDWWSNEYGWTETIPLRDTFTQFERDTLRLPDTGEWVEIDPDAGEFDDEFPNEHSHTPQDVEPGIVGLHAQDSEGRHYYLQIHTNDDGLVIDAYDRYGEEVFATFNKTYDELVDFVFANDPGVEEKSDG